MYVKIKANNGPQFSIKQHAMLNKCKDISLTWHKAFES